MTPPDQIAGRVRRPGAAPVTAPKVADRMCARCVMDTTDPDISFDDQGYCNHCREFFQLASLMMPDPETRRIKLERSLDQVRRAHRNSEYDCVVGVSGGADSSYMVAKAHDLGLRALAIHLDNGWNSELAIRNIERILSNLDIDLHTYVLNWPEFKDLQVAFLKASVVDIEMLTDHAITAVLYREAVQRGIRTILSGSNFVTEAIMPRAWSHRKPDLRNIKAIHRRFGTVPMKTFPTASSIQQLYIQKRHSIRPLTLLDLVEYNKSAAMHELNERFGWEYYGGKHYESTFTRFYQAHILPTKFNVDKRRAHLSTLICSGQMEREDALMELKEPLYSAVALEEDKEYVIKKLGLSLEEFDDLMQQPPRPHTDYPSEVSYLWPLVLLNRKLLERRVAGVGRDPSSLTPS